MATDLSGAFENRVREIVQPMLDEAVDRIMRLLLGASGGTAPRRGRRPAAAAASGQDACNVAGCARPVRSRGYCAAHYQSARKYGWPMPAPKGFKAPVRRRGRPPRKSTEKKSNEKSA